ncbi:hypothetical protein B0H14DRAFT_2579395 [Mycena olivaceomarginata]|nr:hypothetical protein B0H14DRAFT_2579395 [Mycena olivaceomarginata]
MSGSRRRQQPEPAEPPANPSAPAPREGTNQPPHTPLPARQNLSSIPEVVDTDFLTSRHHLFYELRSPLFRARASVIIQQYPFCHITPARRTAAQMAVQLDLNIAMATPGPVERRWQDTQESDPSDGGGNESDDSTDEFPVRLVRHRRTTADGTARQAQIFSLNSDDSELEELEPDVSVGAQRGRRARGQGGGGHRSAPAFRGRASRGRGRATGRAQPDNTEVDFEPGPHPLRGRPAVTGGPPTGYTVDENGFTFFLGRIWSQVPSSAVYAVWNSAWYMPKQAASALNECTLRKSTHRTEYLAEIQRRGWENKLPSASLAKLKQSWMLAAQRIPFSTKDLAKMIVKLIVAQDLLRSLIIEEWVEYWDDLKTELANDFVAQFGPKSGVV